MRIEHKDGKLTIEVSYDDVPDTNERECKTVFNSIHKRTIRNLLIDIANVQEARQRRHKAINYSGVIATDEIRLRIEEYGGKATKKEAETFFLEFFERRFDSQIKEMLLTTLAQDLMSEQKFRAEKPYFKHHIDIPSADFFQNEQEMVDEFGPRFNPDRKENINGRWWLQKYLANEMMRIAFRDPQEAMMFKLKFG